MKNYFSIKSIINTVFLSVLLIFTMSCKQSSQKNDMLNMLEESGVEVPEGMRDESSLIGADIIFPLAVILGLGIIAFIFFIKIRRSKSDFGYAISDISNKMQLLKDKDEIYDKISPEEKKSLEKLDQLFSKKTKQ